MLDAIEKAALLGIAGCLIVLLVLAMVAMIMSVRWDLMGQGFKDLFTGKWRS